MISLGENIVLKSKDITTVWSLPSSKGAGFSSLGWQLVILRSLPSFLLSALEDLSFEPLRNLLINEVRGLVSPSEELFFLFWLMVKLKEVFLNKTSCCLLRRKQDCQAWVESEFSYMSFHFHLFLLFLLLVMFNVKIRMM